MTAPLHLSPLPLPTASRPRMRLIVHLLQPLDAGMGVHLRSAVRGVAQQLLHCPKVGPGIEHVGSKCVPKRVHPEAVSTDGVEHPVHDSLDAAGCHSLPAAA